MPFPKKHLNGSVTKSIRIDKVISNFLKDNFINKPYSANDYLNDLIKNSREYKEYIKAISALKK